MDEAKRFIRYVLPGLVFPLQIILVYALNGDLVNLKDNYLGASFVAFFASGILGFLFSNLYYILHWRIYHKLIAGIPKLDYKKLVIKYEKLFVDFNPKEVYSQKDAWVLLSVYFNFRKEDGVRASENMMKSLSNVSVCIGTSTLTLVASFLACLHSVNCKDILFISINIITLIILVLNYQIVIMMLYNMFDRTLQWLSKRPKRSRKTKSNS